MSTWAITRHKTDYNISEARAHTRVHTPLWGEEVIAKWCSQLLDCVFPIREATAVIRLHRQLAIEDIFTTATWDKNRLDPSEAWFRPNKLQTAGKWGASTRRGETQMWERSSLVEGKISHCNIGD